MVSKPTHTTRTTTDIPSKTVNAMIIRMGNSNSNNQEPMAIMMKGKRVEISFIDYVLTE